MVSGMSFSQTLTKGQKPDHLFAKYCLKYHNYFDGLHEFKALLKLKPDNDYYRWGIGYCHLHLNKDKAAAIPYFVQVLSRKGANQEIWYDLAEAYLVTSQFDKAEEALRKFIAAEVDDKHQITAERMLEMIANARIATKNPVNVEISNLGAIINTEYPEFNPYVNSNEKFIVFSAQHPANSGKYRHEDGYFASDVYYSYFKFGRWRKKKRFSSMINSTNIEHNGYLSSNAAYLYIYKEDLRGKIINHYIYNKRGRSFGYPKEVLIDGVDMSKVLTLMFSPDRKWIILAAPTEESGREDIDLFYSKYNIEGYWMKPIAFDSTINTIYDDSYPYFSPDKKKFYFASKGHNSMGGYDLFQCDLEMDSLYLSSPKNLGYPINTTMDDKTISFNLSGRYAYISSLREGGLGDLDIYRIVLKDKQPNYSYVHGGVYNQDSTDFVSVIASMNAHIDTLNFPINREYKRIILKEKDSLKAKQYLADNKIPYEKLSVKISAVDIISNKVAGKFIVQESTGKFVIILPPGEYRLMFSRNGFNDRYVSKLKIEDYDLRNRDIELHVLLRQK